MIILRWLYNVNYTTTVYCFDWWFYDSDKIDFSLDYIVTNFLSMATA